MTQPTQTLRTVLALDLGTTTGWAIRGFYGLITSGTVSFKPSRYDGGGMRYLRFTNWLTEIDRLSGPIEAIYFEEVRRHIGTDAAHVFGGLLAVLTSWGELRGVPYQGVPVGRIKRHATGKGNANKEAMVAAARARGFSPADDNEADAIALLLWALETKGGVA
jgi:Holliday junction resolvasome RuvABC endonuclease subunit